MGIFKNDNPLNTVLTEGTFASIRTDWDIKPYEGTDFLEGSLQIVTDMNENYNMIRKTIATNELSYIEQFGEDFVYNENAISSFVMAIKKFLYKIWEKLQSLFKSFLMMIDKYSKNDKEFINKYKSKIFGKNLKDFSFDGYIFTINENNIKTAMELCNNLPKLDPSSTVAPNKMSDKNADFGSGRMTDVTKSQNSLEGDMESLRASIAKALNSKTTVTKCSESEFIKECFKAFRNNTEDKEDIGDKIEVSKIAQELQSSSDTRKKVKTCYTECKRIIDQAAKDADSRASSEVRRTEDSYKSDSDPLNNGNSKRDHKQLHDDKVKELHYLFTWTQRSKSVLVALNGAVLNALKQRSKQYKACIIKIVQYNPKNEAVFEHTDPAFMNFIK